MSATELLHHNVTAWNNRDRAAYVSTYADDCSLTSPRYYWDQMAMLGQLGLLPPE